MFQPLNKQIEETEGSRAMVRGHLMRFAVISAISAALFGGLLLLILTLE